MTGIVHRCEVKLLDCMGGDLAVVRAARVSFAKEVTTFESKDAKLIRYLAKHGHWTPFSQVMLQFRIKMPIFVARQWFKHQIGITRNEMSRRYCDDTPEFFLPDIMRARPDGTIKQGSGGEHVDSDYWLREIGWYYDRASELYGEMISRGIAPEQARMVLPQSTMTEFIETGSLAAYARLCKLRIDPHAQEEIRDVAKLVSSECFRIAPVSWTALLEEAS